MTSPHLHENNRPLLIQGAWLPDVATGRLQQHDMLVQGGYIREIVPVGLQVSGDVLVMPASDSVVIPGLSNAHTHSHFVYGRGYGDRWTLELHQNSGSGIHFGAELEDLRLGAMLGAADMIRHGCVAAYDMVVQAPHHTPEGMGAVARGYEATGLRAVIAAAVTDTSFWNSMPGLLERLPPADAHFVRSLSATPASAHIAGLREVFSHWSHDGQRIKPAIAPSVPLLCTDDFMKQVVALANEFELPVQTHLAESKIQAIKAQRRWGWSLTEQLAHVGLLGPRTSAAHGIWIDEHDMQILADHGVAVAHNPGSNMRLGNGVAQTVAMRRHGIRVGIGTDACSCADAQNMIEAMRLAAYSSRICGPDPDRWLDAPTVFHMATAESAAILGFPDTGKLAKGNRADLVFLKRDDLAYLPLNDFYTQLVFSETGRSVHRVMIDGRIVLENSRFTLFDEEQLRREVEARATTLAEQGAERRQRLRAMEPVVSMFCVGLAREPHAFSRYVGGV